MSKIFAIIRGNAHKILTDILTVGASVGAILLFVQQLSTTVHLPAGANAIIAGATTLLATILAEVRRIITVTNAPAPAPNPAPAPAKATKAAAKPPAKRAAGR